MAEITVEQLAKVVGISVVSLLEKLRDAGVAVSDPKEVLDNRQKQILLRKLKEENNSRGEVTLSRKVVGGSKEPVVNITVLKRRSHYEVEANDEYSRPVLEKKD